MIADRDPECTVVVPNTDAAGVEPGRLESGAEGVGETEIRGSHM